MGNDTCFITNSDQLMETVLSMLEKEAGTDVLISGTFVNPTYKGILSKIESYGSLGCCRIIIPYVSRNGLLSRAHINKIIESGGQVRINSKFNNNLLVIGEQALVMSFSSKYNNESGMRIYFECGVYINEEDTVRSIKNSFTENWQRSMPLSKE